jgi:hypothetical protein
MQDKPFRMMPRCGRCGRGKNQHRAMTLECPVGKRTAIGYASERFRDPDCVPTHGEHLTDSAPKSQAA